MARFLLIHGASHGAWCWHKLLPLLEAGGHDVLTVDLPGHGADTTPRETVRLADYTNAITAQLTQDTILVAHSFGGFPMTLAAAQQPGKVRGLVYLAALLPVNGKAFTDFRQDAISKDVSATQDVDRAAGVTKARPEAAAVYYSDCSEEDRAFAMAHLTPQPIAVMTETVTFQPPDNPRHYIRCLDDRVVFPSYQTQVSEGWENTHDMGTGHSPFFSDPNGLAKILDEVARRI